MSVDEDVFFREATLRICSSLNIVTPPFLFVNPVQEEPPKKF